MTAHLGQAGHMMQSIPFTAAPGSAPQLLPASFPSSSAMMGGSPLLVPGPSTSASSSALLQIPTISPMSSIPPSPVLSELSWGSHQSKHFRLTQSGLYQTTSLPLPVVSPTISSDPSFHSPIGVSWTPADQADWERLLARFTASAGLPLQWVENHEWKTAAQNKCRGLEVTLQCDGWTSENSHHLIGFTITAQQKWNLIVGDLFKAKDDYTVYGDMAQDLITWLHTLEILIAKHEDTILSMGDRRSQGNTFTAIATIKDATFWHAMARWKNLLEPIAIMTNMHQATHARPEHHCFVTCGFAFIVERVQWNFSDLDHYLGCFGDFAFMEVFKNSLLARAQQMHTPVDALEVWNGSSHPGADLQQLHRIAKKNMHMIKLSRSGSNVSMLKNLQEPAQQENHHPLSEEVEKGVEEEEMESSSMESPTTNEQQFTKIPIEALLDYSQAESWLGPFYEVALRGLDDDLELYQLLDLDAEGEDDPDHVFIG
ncbi:hypothetical protein BKA82DRAFT_4016974 [Pisolithus tinctorius]|nr:hypothetical protein BKA82DRAFT_4016974 [Pisolithus tinctorius]